MKLFKKMTLSLLSLFVAAAMIIVPAAADAATEAKVIYGVNFRSAPSTSSTVYRMLQKGETIQVLAEVDSYWLEVKDREGKVGYISSSPKYTTYASEAGSSTGSSPLADRIIATAKSLMGKVSYEYGVRNPSKMIFDCSSFVEYVFEKHGVSLPWGTRYLQNVGTYVSKSNLKKGDLVFFATGSSKSINHVGIYIGNGQFIHNTPSKDGLAINSLETGYWKDHYVTARRVL